MTVYGTRVVAVAFDSDLGDGETMRSTFDDGALPYGRPLDHSR